MKTPKNVNVELLKNNSIRMSLVEDVAEYPVKERRQYVKQVNRQILITG